MYVKRSKGKRVTVRTIRGRSGTRCKYARNGNIVIGESEAKAPLETLWRR
jgi:hypothetical protein